MLVCLYCSLQDAQSVPAGACGLPTHSSQTWPWHVVALSANSSIALSSDGSAACGACVEVQCVGGQVRAAAQAACLAAAAATPRAAHTAPPRASQAGCIGGPITAVVTDTCASCGATQINLHTLAFTALATGDAGQIAVRFRQVGLRPGVVAR